MTSRMKPCERVLALFSAWLGLKGVDRGLVAFIETGTNLCTGLGGSHGLVVSASAQQSGGSAV